MSRALSLLGLVVAVVVVAAVCLTAPVSAVQYTPAALADKIDNLPGLVQQPSFNQFAGYLVVNETSQKSIFYWYVESQNAPATDPLLWWSNGGPGCSGLLGFLTEHGPFRPSTQASNEGGLDYFDFAWNRMANVLYVEAPAGVGFSFSNDANDYTTGDGQTATDNHASIKLFFERFPHLLNNKLYLTSESYGGHYVPTLAQSLVRAGDVPSFAGIFLGNPYTDPEETANWGQAGTICGHALASRPTCDTFTTHCLGPNGPDAQCDAAQSNVMAEAGALDLYGLDFPQCPQPQPLLVRSRFLKQLYAEKMHAPGFNPQFRAQLELLPAYDPCAENKETAYLNRADVRAALHVNPNVGPWSGCSKVINYSVSDNNAPMEPIYPELIAVGGLRLVIFSGDDDSVCATLGTQHWMFDLFGSDVVAPWKQWTYDSEDDGMQIGGSIVQFKGISLVTVHGAGHMVSGYRPEKGLIVLANYLNGTFSSANEPREARDHRQTIATQ